MSGAHTDVETLRRRAHASEAVTKAKNMATGFNLLCDEQGLVSAELAQAKLHMRLAVMWLREHFLGSGAPG